MTSVVACCTSKLPKRKFRRKVTHLLSPTPSVRSQLQVKSSGVLMVLMLGLFVFSEEALFGGGAPDVRLSNGDVAEQSCDQSAAGSPGELVELPLTRHRMSLRSEGQRSASDKRGGKSSPCSAGGQVYRCCCYGDLCVCMQVRPTPVLLCCPRCLRGEPVRRRIHETVKPRPLWKRGLQSSLWLCDWLRASTVSFCFFKGHFNHIMGL